MIYIGADHRGFNLKEKIKAHWLQNNVRFVDVGAQVLKPEDDYVDYALKLAETVALSPSLRVGILICGSGVGMTLAANKVPGIRAGLGINAKQAVAAKEDDHINVLTVAADYIDESEAVLMIDSWLKADVKDEMKYRRRLDKLATHEEQVFKLGYMPR